MPVACKLLPGNKPQRITNEHKTPKKAPKPPKEEWRLEWSEGFERIDPANWRINDFAKGGGSTGFNPANAQASEGHLVLTLSNEPYFEKTFSGAEVFSLREIAFGRLEVKMRLPRGKGISCSLMSTSAPGTSTRPHDEVSISFRGGEPRTVYFDYFKRKERIQNGNSYFLPFDITEGFHVYSIERSHKFIKWYIDGKLYYQSYEQVPGSAQRVAFSIWSNLTESFSDNLPATLVVDYAKYFTRKR